MAKTTIIFKTLIASIIVIVVIFMAYKFVSPRLSSKKFQTEQKQEAIKRFGEIRISSFSPDVKQDFIDAITGEEGWGIAFEKTVVKETGYLNNPYFVVQTYLFKNKDGSRKMLMDKLYLYDDYSLQWIPISEQTDLIVDEKFVDSKNTDIWSTGNNWVKAYSKDNVEKNPVWDKCSDMVLSEDFDIETDLPEDHECYQTQQDFQVILNMK